MADHSSDAIKKILLVDDEQDITTVMRDGLERTGRYKVDAFNDPKEALEHFRAGEYDLLLLDIRMPDMNGFQLHKELARIDNRPRVCFITAFEMYYDEFRKVFPSTDVKCFIRKPVSIANLVKQIGAEFQSTPQRVRSR